MSSQDDFIHVASASSSSRSNTVISAFYDNFAGKFTFTEGVIARRIREQYPHHHLSIVYSGSCDLLSYADAHDDTTRTPHGDSKDALIERGFLPPAKKDGKECNGAWVEYVTYACYEYVFRSKKFLVYVIEGGEGQYRDPKSYILVPPPDSDAVTPSIEWLSVAQKRADELIAEVSAWGLETHNEILIFDGYWKKDNELWQNVQNSEWKDVILEEEKKKAIIDDVIGFFDNEDRYKDLGVPWKRGIILYGPPGNGKTISVKALMHDVSKRTSPIIDTLYVKSFRGSFDVHAVFVKARQMAPCLLLFEDIDTLVTPLLRSYFLNEVDGLESNHGILMIGSTNHLEMLDPGIAKRPSRFDRKYYFGDPNLEERVQYCEYWRGKLKGNGSVDFPREVSERAAEITEGFSFAYLKEAFVAALLVIAGKKFGGGPGKEDDDLEGNSFWKELEHQIENLRQELEAGDGEEDFEGNLEPKCLPGFTRAKKPASKHERVCYKTRGMGIVKKY